jgi:hypothetical protein
MIMLIVLISSIIGLFCGYLDIIYFLLILGIILMLGMFLEDNK